MKSFSTSIQAGLQNIEGRAGRSPGIGSLAILGLAAVAACFFAGCAFASEEGAPPDKAKGKILVAFATSKGSTREIAEAIASEIGAAGWQAEAVNLKDAPLAEGYDHVILGGPIYYGKIKEVRAFVDKHSAVLEERLEGAFAVGMAFAVDNEEQAAEGRKALDEAIAPLKPDHLGYFAGRIDPDKLSLLEKAAIKMVKSPVGDFRDLDAVRNWARKIAESLD